MTEGVPVSVLCPYFLPVSLYRTSPQTSVGPGVRQRSPRVPVGLVVPVPPGNSRYRPPRVRVGLGPRPISLGLHIAVAPRARGPGNSPVGVPGCPEMRREPLSYGLGGGLSVTSVGNGFCGVLLPLSSPRA